MLKDELKLNYIAFVLTGKIHVTMRECVQQLISLFRSLCMTFGRPYAEKKVRKCFFFLYFKSFEVLRTAREEIGDGLFCNLMAPPTRFPLYMLLLLSTD